MQWFKFYGSDYLSDPKMLALTGSERSCWITLLSYACVADDNGAVKHVTSERLLIQSGIEVTSDEWDRTINVLQKFVKLDMITHDNEIIVIKNWRKRQNLSLTGYERVKKYREKKKMITDDNDDDNIRREEKRREYIPAKAVSKNKKMNYEEPTLNNETGEVEKPQKSTIGESYKNLLKWAENERGQKFIQPLKQFKAMKILREAGISIPEIKQRWKEMQGEEFYKKTGIDFMMVVSSLNKKR